MAEEPHTWGDSFPEKCPPPPGSGLLTTLTHPRAQAHTRPPPHTHTQEGSPCTRSIRRLPDPREPAGPSCSAACWLGPDSPQALTEPAQESRGCPGAVEPRVPAPSSGPRDHHASPQRSHPQPGVHDGLENLSVDSSPAPGQAGVAPRGPGMPSPGDGLQTSCGLPVIPHSSPSHPAPCTDPLSRPTGPICSDPDWASGAPSGPPLCAPAGRTPALRVSHPLPAGFPHSAEAVPSPPCPHGRQSKPLP